MKHTQVSEFETAEGRDFLRCQGTEQIVTYLATTSDPIDIATVAKYFRGTTRWIEFVRFCIDPETAWSYPKPVNALRELLDRNTLKVLVSEKSQAVEAEIGQLGIDEYWNDRVRYLIANNALDHAWDEIVKAFRGVEEKSLGKRPIRRFNASVETLATLIFELARVVGEEDLKKKTTWRGRTYSGHVHEMRLFLNHLPENNPNRKRLVAVLSFQLQAYFGERKVTRRNNRKEQKLSDYKSRTQVDRL